MARTSADLPGRDEPGSRDAPVDPIDGATISLEDEVVRGQDLVLILAWWVPIGVTGHGSNPRFFAHLLDGRGRKWGEANEISYPQERWRPGDRVISWLRIPVEPDV